MTSRFATEEEVFSDQFWAINNELLRLNNIYSLSDHREINRLRFRWWEKISESPAFYGARFWEYPFAITSADLKPGMKCADVGCGTTPFTAYLAEKVGSGNVTGFDPDIVLSDNDIRHSSFGMRDSFVKKIKINFYPDSLFRLSSPNNYFDRVFCISVLEHIADFEDQIKGLNELTRVLKPGGRLIITMDVGINTILTHPLDMLKLSGLVPAGLVDYRWPAKRFVRYEGDAMDVFGLVLEKPLATIDSDYDGMSEITFEDANKKYKSLYEHFLMSYNEALFIKEMRISKFKSIVKALLGKY